jgi:S-adenosylmethionine decarboxylase
MSCKGHKGSRGYEGWQDLAPDICRQRLIIEGTLHNVFLPEDMTQYAKEISKVLNMEPITSPVLNHEPKYGWCAFVHWKESGMHIYTWDNRLPKFFSVDIYTCKEFDPMDAVRYTEEFFKDNLIKITWRE